MHKIDTFYTSDEFQPYKDNTGRQLRHILFAGLARWAITALMCVAYAAATIIWQHKPAQGETSKRLYNAITTGVSIALGLNIASAFKDMALNMRWVILSNRKRNLIEVGWHPNSSSIPISNNSGRSPPSRRLHAEAFQAGLRN
jgi:hypothetical protein